MPSPETKDVEMEVCSKCGAKPVYITVPTADFENPGLTQRVADHCSNPSCEYLDRRRVDNDWIVNR